MPTLQILGHWGTLASSSWFKPNRGVAVHGTDLYLVKLRMRSPKKFKHILSRTPTTLLVTIVVKLWPLTICSWSVQCYREVTTNTTELTHCILSLRQFPILAQWNSCEERNSSIWFEWSDLLYNSSFQLSPNWCSCFNFNLPLDLDNITRLD